MNVGIYIAPDESLLRTPGLIVVAARHAELEVYLMTILTTLIQPNTQIMMGPTAFMTERNEHEVRCGSCARIAYVDKDTYRLASAAINAGLDNPFRCEICAEHFDDLIKGT
jgi:hypothetical protein